MKDYKDWMPVKARVNNSTKAPLHFKERDIWWVHVGDNVGFEEDGKGEEYLRPVLIVRKFSKRLFFGVPLSTTNKRGEYYYAFTASGKRKESVAILSQCKPFDALRLVRKYGMCNENNLKDVKEKLRSFL